MCKNTVQSELIELLCKKERFFCLKYIFCIVALFPLSSRAELLATESQQTIQGVPPALLDSAIPKVINNMGVKVGDNIFTGNNDTLISVSPMTKLTEFEVYTDFSQLMNNIDLVDLDGDGSHYDIKASLINQSIVWQDKSNNTISNSALKFYSAGTCDGTSATANGPYTVTVTGNVVLSTKYGDPNSSRADNIGLNGQITKTYKVNGSAGVCYLKPLEMTYISGYNDATRNSQVSPDFVANYGFKANATTKFPTTAFPGASFTLETLGGSSLYRFYLVKNPNGALSPLANDTNNTFIFSGNTPALNSDYIIKATRDGTDYFYTFQIKRWFVPNSSGVVNHDKAVDICNTANKGTLPTRAEMSNASTSKGSPSGSDLGNNTLNSFVRAIDDSVNAEWGRLTTGYYPKGNWAWDWYWTNDINTNYKPNQVQYYYSAGAVQGNNKIGDGAEKVVCLYK